MGRSGWGRGSNAVGRVSSRKGASQRGPGCPRAISKSLDPSRGRSVCRILAYVQALGPSFPVVRGSN